jgi:glycosidase
MNIKSIIIKSFVFICIIATASCSNNDSNTSAPNGSSSNIDGFFPKPTADIVMYEINPTAFSASKNLQGITNRLDNIKALGINTIWIMPIYPVGVVNSFGSPYCVKDYTSVRSSLGNLQDLKNFGNNLTYNINR